MIHVQFGRGSEFGFEKREAAGYEVVDGAGEDVLLLRYLVVEEDKKTPSQGR
jgi:hypothetical protein